MSFYFTSGTESQRKHQAAVIPDLSVKELQLQNEV